MTEPLLPFSPWLDLLLLWILVALAGAVVWCRRPRPVVDDEWSAFLRDLQRIYELPEVK